MRAQEFITQGLVKGTQPGKPVVDAILRVMPDAQEIWFHGSRATGRHRKHSDTDILVVVPDDIVGDQYLDVVRTLQKLNSDFDNYDIQPTKAGTNIQRIAQQEGRLLWSKPGVAEDAFHGIEITLQDLGDDMIQIEAHAAGRELGYVTFVQEGDTLLPQDLHVDERYRGQGIAAAMYDYAKSRGYKIRRSGQQTDAGAGFWAKHRPEQNVWEGNEFNQCFDQACKLYDQAVSKRLQPKLVQVADFQGDGSGADARWIKLPQHVWQHYVVIVGDQVLDPTATQFGDDMPTKYPVSDLDKLWAKQYQIRPRPGVAENTIESVDVDAIHAAALREHLLLNPTVLEGRDDTNRIKSFLDLHSTPRPHVGDQYVYASVQITPLADYVNIAHFGSQHQLIDLTHDHAYFDIDGTTKRFPEKGSLSGDSLSQIYFFDSKKDFDQFAIMLSLKLSDYKHSSQLLDEPKIVEDIAKQDPVIKTVTDFYINDVGSVHPQPLEDYVAQAKDLLSKVQDQPLKSKLLGIFKQANKNPYIQGGVITTVGALLAGGVLASAQKFGLSPTQTNMALQAVLNTVIPTMVSRVNGKNWTDTIKYTVASAGIGTGIAAMTENFADGKNPQDRGDSARHGIPRHATIAQLEKIRSSKTASPRKKQLAHWAINMRRGRAKSRK